MKCVAVSVSAQTTNVIRLGLFCAVIFLAFTTWTTHVHVAYAQTLPNSGEARLVPSPTFPGPNTDVTLTLDDYSISAIGADIRWYVNGVEYTKNINKRSITIDSGELGTKKSVSARISRQSGSTITATHTVVPIAIDVILESDTYVPNFYRGRALPSSGASVRAIAVVHDGTAVSPSAYSYKWTLDTDVISGGALKGGNAVEIVVPRFGAGEITLEVFDTRGTVVGKRIMYIGAIEPTLLFYTYSPLRGLAEGALRSSAILTGQEATIYAEPYFLNTPKIDSSHANFTWKVNKRSIPTDANVANAITLGNQGGGSASNIDVAVTTDVLGFQYLEDTLKVNFK